MENKKGKIVIHLEGGIIQDIDYNGNDVEIEIRDYDTEGIEEDGLKEDEEGREYYAY